MVKKLDFIEKTVHASNDLQDNVNMRNIGRYNDGADKYWWAEVVGNDLLIKSIPVADPFNQASSIEHTYATGKTIASSSVLLRSFDDTIVAGSIVIEAGVSFVFASYSTDGGSSWNDVTVGVGGVSGRAFDVAITASGAGAILLWGYIQAGSLRIKANDIFGTAGSPVQVTGGATNQQMYAGYTDPTDDDIYYCVVYDDSQSRFEFYKLVISTPVWSLVSTNSDLTPPASFDVNKQQYFVQSGNQYLIDEDHFYYKELNNDWTSYSASGSSTTCIIWAHTAAFFYEINYIVWNDRIHKIEDSGGMQVVKDITTEAQIGMDDWYVDSTNKKMFQASIEDATEDYQKFHFKTRIYFPPQVKIALTTVEPTENQSLFIYNDSDALLYQGRIRDYDDNTAQYKLKMESPINTDYNQKVDKSYVNQTGHAIIKDLIDTYCSYLKYGAATISTTPTALFTVRPRNLRVLDIIKIVDKDNGYITSVRADFTVYWNQMTASGKTIDDSVDGMPIIPSKKPVKLKVSHLILYGGWDEENEQKFKSEAFGEPNYGTLIDWIPLKKSQAALDALRDQYMINQNITFNKYRLGAIGKGKLDEGTTFTLSLILYGLVTDTVYVIEVEYDALTDEMLSIVCTDALWIPVNKNQTTQASLAKSMSDQEQYTDDMNVDIRDYVDRKIAEAAPTHFFLTDTNSDIGGYELLEEAYSNAAEQSWPVPSMSDGDPLEEFITPLGGLGVVVLGSGLYAFHFRAEKTGGTKDAQIYFEMYQRDVGGSETLLVTSETSNPLTGTQDPYEIHAHLDADVVFVATDRLVFKVIVTVSGLGTDPSVTLYAQTGNESHFTVPGIAVNNVYVKKIGDTMTGLLTFGGDQAGGGVYVPLDTNDSANQWYDAQTVTNGDEVKLDPVAGAVDFEDAGITRNGFDAGQTVPAGTKAIHVEIRFRSTVINGGNSVRVRRQGNTNPYNTLSHFSVEANIWASNAGIVQLNTASSQISIIFARAAGTVRVIMKLLGYFI